PVDLWREDESAFSQAGDLVGPDRDLGPAPAEADVRMVSLLLGEVADATDKLLRPAEVRKLVNPLQMMFIDRFPAVQLNKQVRDLLALQRRHATATRNALTTC